MNKFYRLQSNANIILYTMTNEFYTERNTKGMFQHINTQFLLSRQT